MRRVQTFSNFTAIRVLSTALPRFISLRKVFSGRFAAGSGKVPASPKSGHRIERPVAALSARARPGTAPPYCLEAGRRPRPEAASQQRRRNDEPKWPLQHLDPEVPGGPQATERICAAEGRQELADLC